MSRVEVLENGPYVARVEVVSLRTAAAAAGGNYAWCPAEKKIFNIFDRQFIDRSRNIEVAMFNEVDVIPGAMWKICLNHQLYVEELGYSDHNKLYGIECFNDWDGRRVVRVQSDLMSVPDVPDGAILLGCDPAHYHFILNWLPKLRSIDLIEKTFGKQKELHFVMSDRIADHYYKLFDLILDRPYKITKIPESGVWRFHNLIVPNYFSSNELHAGIAEWYREKLNIGRGPGRRRLYLSRKDAWTSGVPRRKVVNEGEVVSELEKFGFLPVLLDGMDIQQQIELFSDVEFVVGPHGGAFANMQFTPAGAKALVLENEWTHDFMVDMLTVAGHRAAKLVCKDNIDLAYEKDFIVDGVVEPEIRRSRDMLVDINALLEGVRQLERV